MRIPLIISLGVAVIGIIFGSFFDLQISQAIASPKNNFALMVSAIGPTIGFAGVAIMGGGFVAFIIKGNYNIILKLLFGVLALCCLGVAIYYPAGEYFGINGFYGVAPKAVGYAIVVLPELGAAVLGYFLFKDIKNTNTWILFCIVIVLLLIALLAVIPTIKDNMHRPRFRCIIAYPIEFHNWWEPCKDYKDLMSTYGIEKDNFKSYPSGHTAEAAILLAPITFLPLADKKFERYQMPLFYGACGLILLVAFARILAAAHFLSDVSWGATIMITLVLIANEAVVHIKSLQIE